MTNNIIQREKKYLLQNYSRPDDFIPVSGKGSILKDINGKEYLDFVAGISVNAMGHNYDPIVKAAENQIKKFIHISNLYHYESHVNTAELLVNNSCLNKVFFCNSGTEAIEAAIKFARRYNIENFNKNKIHIITFKNGFHGRTYGALSSTAQTKFHYNFGPMLKGFDYCELNDINSFKKSISKNTAAVITEFIQGEGGGYIADKKFIKEIYNICKKNNILFIADEIQTGIGRTGKFFAYEHYKIKPDIITTAKPLGAGFPLAAVILNESIAKFIKPGDHGTTFGGNPVACAASIPLLKKIQNKKFLNQVSEKGVFLKNKLKEINSDKIKDIRGLGLWVCLETDTDPVSVINECRKKGLLLCKAGKSSIRFLPSLNVTKKEIKKAVSIFKSVITNI